MFDQLAKSKNVAILHIFSYPVSQTNLSWILAATLVVMDVMAFRDAAYH